MFEIAHSRWWRVAAIGLLLLTPAARPALMGADETSVEELKARVANASVGERPALCLQISERQLANAGKFYDAGNSEQGKAALADVVAFSELARDYAIQSHRNEKKSEITIRRMTRKLNALKHAVTHDEQTQVQNAIDRLQKIRDDLLAAMFPKVGKP